MEKREAARCGWELKSPLAEIRFKRIIVDEGPQARQLEHGAQERPLLVLECLQVSGSVDCHGHAVDWALRRGRLHGGDQRDRQPQWEWSQGAPSKRLSVVESSAADERNDLDRIGAMACLYLKARPWANVAIETGDTPAQWSVYVLQPKHSSRSGGRKDALRATLDSLIIRHRRSEIGDLLPSVDEKITVLDGSYQDKLCLNLFSMMIIFNAVQSQRQDQDYFFHPSQRKRCWNSCTNIRQSSFFGGSFFSGSDITKAVQTAETFLAERKVPISEADEQQLRDAINFGHLALRNHAKMLAELFHEVPIYVKDFPGGPSHSRAWSLDERASDPVCTNAPMMLALQKLLRAVYRRTTLAAGHVQRRPLRHARLGGAHAGNQAAARHRSSTAHPAGQREQSRPSAGR